MLSGALLAMLWCGTSFAAPFIDATFNYSECYARIYTTAHLGSHPRQAVTSISVGRIPGAEDLSLSFTMRNGRRYTGLALCMSGGSAAQCLLDGDAGTFALSWQDGRLRLDVGEWLSLEGETDFSPDLASEGDDRIFLLDPADKRFCR